MYIYNCLHVRTCMCVCIHPFARYVAGVCEQRCACVYRTICMLRSARLATHCTCSSTLSLSLPLSLSLFLSLSLSLCVYTHPIAR